MKTSRDCIGRLMKMCWDRARRPRHPIMTELLLFEKKNLAPLKELRKFKGNTDNGTDGQVRARKSGFLKFEGLKGARNNAQSTNKDKKVSQNFNECAMTTKLGESTGKFFLNRTIIDNQFRSSSLLLKRRHQKIFQTMCSISFLVRYLQPHCKTHSKHLKISAHSKQECWTSL